MGDRNGVAYAQQAHEYILKSAGLLGEAHWLRFGDSIPLHDMWQGAYVDDVVISLKLPITRLPCHPGHDDSCPHCQHDGGRLADVLATDDLIAGYEQFDAARSPEKATRFKPIFTAWGTEVNGRAGRAEVNVDKRRQICRLAYSVVRFGRTSRAVLMSLVGSLVHPFMHCRHLMSSLSLTYDFMQSMPHHEEQRIPAAVCDELLACSLLLACSYADLRAQVSTTISATDATPQRGGACRAVLPQKLCNALYRRGEQRGEHGCLRWTDVESELRPTRMQRPTTELDEIVTCLPWTDPRGWNFKRTQHINIQELLAVLDEVRLRINQGLQRSRIIIMIDSRVCVGAIAKGRSSSKLLNTHLRRLSILALAARVQVRVVWTATSANPADAPSRGVELPARTLMPHWIHKLVKDSPRLAESSGVACVAQNVAPCRLPGMPHQRIIRQKNSKQIDTALLCGNCSDTSTRDGSCSGEGCSSGSDSGSSDDPPVRVKLAANATFREYYSGVGGLSRAMRRKGFQTIEFDAYASGTFDPALDLADPRVIEVQIEDAKAGKILGAHFGFVCSSWSRMMHTFNGGTRSFDQPYGDGSRETEDVGNRQVREGMRFIRVLLELGIPITVENPHDSMIWHSDEMRELEAHSDTNSVVFDQCMYSLRPPDFDPKDNDDRRVRKRTKIVGSVRALNTLSRVCNKQHCHVEAWGHCRLNGKLVSRAKAAGAYPVCLCLSIAKLFLQHPTGPIM